MTVSWMVVPGRLILAPILVQRFSQDQTEQGAITEEEEQEEEEERERLKGGWWVGSNASLCRFPQLNQASSSH